MAVVEEAAVRGQEGSSPAGTKGLMRSSWYHTGVASTWHL